MMQLWLMSTERSLRAGAVVCAAAVLLVPTMGASGTTDTVRNSRLHHASAGHAPVVAPEVAAKPHAGKSGSAKSNSSKSKSSTARKKEAAPPVANKAKPRRKRNVEPEEVADPIPMHRASNARPSHAAPSPLNSTHKEPARSNEIARSEAGRGLPAMAPTQLAGNAAPAAHAPHSELITGVSHPEQVEPSIDPETSAEPAEHHTPEQDGDGDTPVVPHAASPSDAVVHDLMASVVPLHDEYPGEAVITHQPELTYRNGRVVVPAPLKGSHEVLVHQNFMADGEHLDRIQDDEELEQLIARHQLVNFPEAAGVRLNPELPGERRVARVWTVRFVEDMAHNFYERFHQPLYVSSAVRTVAYQLRLERVNGNAAGIDGESASPHLTGQAIDIAKRGMTMVQLAWMREYLMPLMQAGTIDVEEEFKQSCFHISVYKSYLPKTRMEVARLAK